MTAAPVAWRPDAALLRESAAARFIAAEGIPAFRTLFHRSIDDPEWFWPAVLRFLGPVRGAVGALVATVTGNAPGDLSSLEDRDALEAIAEAV
jgi:hypothetical protein